MNPRILHHAFCSNDFACLNYIWEWSIHYGSLCAMFTLLHSSMNQELFKKYISNHFYPLWKTWWCRMPQVSSETEVSIAFLCQLLHSSMNQELFEKHLCNQGSHYEHYPKEAINCNHQINFSLSAKMNGTQRRTLVSPWRMHCMHCSMPKGTTWAEATSNSKKSWL